MGRISAPPEPDVRRKKKNCKLRLILLLLVLPAVLLAAYTWLNLHDSYSTGERNGYIQKIFEKKGWLCSTWEGELAMTTFPGTAPQSFSSV